MASRAFVESFFPSVSASVRARFPSPYYFIFPDDAAALCPEPTISLSVDLNGTGFLLSRPMLFIAAVSGGAIGIHLGHRLLRSSQNEKDFIWSLSFLAFGAMNIDAAIYHCLLSSQLRTAASWPATALWVLDCSFTGICTMCVTFAALFPRKAAVDAMFLILVLIIAVYIETGNTLLLELWYIIPTALVSVAVPVEFCRKFDSNKKGKCYQAMLITYAGGTTWLAGVLLDAWCCRHFIGLYDLITASTSEFFGSDIFYLGLWMWIVK